MIYDVIALIIIGIVALIIFNKEWREAGSSLRIW